jgi:hypothetical protein
MEKAEQIKNWAKMMRHTFYKEGDKAFDLFAKQYVEKFSEMEKASLLKEREVAESFLYKFGERILKNTGQDLANKDSFLNANVKLFLDTHYPLTK